MDICSLGVNSSYQMPNKGNLPDRKMPEFFELESDRFIYKTGIKKLLAGLFLRPHQEIEHNIAWVRKEGEQYSIIKVFSGQKYKRGETVQLSDDVNLKRINHQILQVGIKPGEVWEVKLGSDNKTYNALVEDINRDGTLEAYKAYGTTIENVFRGVFHIERCLLDVQSGDKLIKRLGTYFADCDGMGGMHVLINYDDKSEK